MLKPLLCKKYSGVSITRPFFLIQIGSTKYSIQLNHSYMLACIRKIQEWAWIFWVEFVQLTNHGSGASLSGVPVNETHTVHITLGSLYSNCLDTETPLFVIR